MKTSILGVVFAALPFLAIHTPAQDTLFLDFDDYLGGRIIDDEYVLSHGVTFSVINPNNGGDPDLGVLYPSNVEPPAGLSTGLFDPDLQGPPTSYGNWATGNAATESAGNVLISQETNPEAAEIAAGQLGNKSNPPDIPGLTDDQETYPDDQGSGSTIVAVLDTPARAVRFNWVDLDNGASAPAKLTIRFVDTLTGGSPSIDIPVLAFVTNNGNPFYDSTVAWADGSFDRLEEMDLDEINFYEANYGPNATTLTRFNRVEWIVITSGGLGDFIEFEPIAQGCFGDIVFNDTDSDGVFEPNKPNGTDETGIPGVVMNLYQDNNNDGVFDGGDTLYRQTETDANGFYEFIGLPAGNYVVVVDETGVLSGMTSTGPNIDEDGETLSTDECYAAGDFGYTSSILAVDLVSFEAHPGGAGEPIVIAWETEAEIDNLGFNLYRAIPSPMRRGPGSGGGWSVGPKLNDDLIPADPTALLGGAEYAFTDLAGYDPAAARGYFLEDVDASGRTTLHGPAMILPSKRDSGVESWRMAE
ncbi:MAG: SdrD B-like domain-containing protein [Sumerlaeia bacterium]